MKYLIITLATIILTLTACNSRTGLKQEKKAPELEMIFGKEKKELESYIHFIDSLKTCANLPVDTTLFHKGNYILEDSLGESNNASALFEIIARAKAEQAGSPIQSKLFTDLNSVLNGKIKYESYPNYLKELNKINYLVVVKKFLHTNPKLRSNKEFEGGLIMSLVEVIDLHKKIIVKSSFLTAESSKTVETSTRYGMSQMDIDQDFWGNYHKNRSELLDKLFK